VIHGATSKEMTPPAQRPSFISDTAWKMLCALSTLEGFKGTIVSTQRPNDLSRLADVVSHILKHPAAWRTWYDSSEPQNIPPPCVAIGIAMDKFDRLLILRCLRRDKLYSAVQVRCMSIPCH